MPKYEILVPEIHYQTVTINANDAREAISLIIEGGGDVVEGALEYSCVHEEALENMLIDIEHFDWAITELPDICEKCEKDDATATRFVGDKELNLCDICAGNQENDEDE